MILHDAVRRALIRDVSTLKSELGNADAVIVTGDIAYSGQREEYQEATDWLVRLCDAAGCERLSVFVVPGNHDVDWSEVDQLVRDQHERLANLGPGEVDEFISSRYHSKQGSSLLLGKLNNYREFANQYGRDFKSFEDPCWTEPTITLGSLTVCFVGMNTVLFSDKHDAKGHLVLGRSQYITSLCSDDNGDNTEYIVLMHHPFDWLKDGLQAKQWLENRARIWLMGHEHTFGVNKVINLQGFERLEIQAAATNPPAEDGYEFRYNWLTLSVYAEGTARRLAVTVCPRVWTFSSTSFVADSNILQGDKSKDFHLTLPDTEIETVVEEMQRSEENRTMPGFIDSDEEASSMSESNQAVTRDDGGFRRLQFLFWRELDRNQRISLLAELDMLPDDFEASPVWIRRGLDAARRQGRLHELWNGVMRYLPDEQHEHNPFQLRREAVG